MIILFKSLSGLFSVHTKSMPERAGARENRTTDKDKEKEHKNVRARNSVASRVGIAVVVDVPRAAHAHVGSSGAHHRGEHTLHSYKFTQDVVQVHQHGRRKYAR